MENASDRGILRQMLVDYFDDEELEDLCFDKFSDISSSFTMGMTKNQKARKIVGFLERRGRLDELRTALAQMRPKPYAQVFGYTSIVPAADRKSSKIEKWVTEFRNRLNAEDMHGAKRILVWLQAEELREEETESLIIAEKLIRLAGLSEQSHKLVAETRTWPNECIVAYVMARDKLEEWKEALEKQRTGGQPDEIGKNRWKTVFDSLNQARYYLPVDQAGPEANDRLWMAEAKSVEPLPMEIPDPFASEADESDEWRPFAGEKAEDETDALFVRDAFWPHPLFKDKLQENKASYVVFGHHRSGRTALALALSSPHFGSRDRPVLALYLSGRHSISDMEALFTARLLEIIRYNPTHLSKMSSDERTLLGQLLAVTVGVDHAKVVVRRAEAEIYSLAWNEPESGYSSSQKADWHSLAETQLQLLYQTLSELALSNRPASMAVRWPNTVSACAKALGLKEVILALDTSDEEDDIKWVNQEILPNLRLWHARGLRVILFLPTDTAIKFRPEHGVVRHESLKWEKDEMKAFAKWRYEKLTPSKIEWYLDKKGLSLDDLVSQSEERGTHNPGRFMEVWRSATAEEADTAPNTR